MRNHTCAGLTFRLIVARVSALLVTAAFWGLSVAGCARSEDGGPAEIAAIVHTAETSEGVMDIAYFPRLKASPLLMYKSDTSRGKPRLEHVSGRWVIRHREIAFEAPPRAVIYYDAGENAFLAASRFWQVECIDEAESRKQFAEQVNTEMKATVAAANKKPTPPVDSGSFRVDSALGPLIGIYMVFDPRKEGVLLLSTSTNAPTPKLSGRKPGWWLESGEKRIMVPERSVVLYLEDRQEVAILGVNWEYTVDDESRDKVLNELIDDWMNKRR